jgi:hypothetical protein
MAEKKFPATVHVYFDNDPGEALAARAATDRAGDCPLAKAFKT